MEHSKEEIKELEKQFLVTTKDWMIDDVTNLTDSIKLSMDSYLKELLPFMSYKDALKLIIKTQLAEFDASLS